VAQAVALAATAVSPSALAPDTAPGIDFAPKPYRCVYRSARIGSTVAGPSALPGKSGHSSGSRIWCALHAGYC